MKRAIFFLTMGVALYAQAELVYLKTSDQSEANNSFTN